MPPFIHKSHLKLFKISEQYIIPWDILPFKQHDMMKGLFITLGTLFVGLGILGVFLPLLPTTPFLLVAAACYAKGSERFYQRLISNQWLSPYILAYRSNEGLPVKLKIRILLLLWSSILLTVTLALTSTLAKLFLISIAVLVSTSILRLPTKR